MKHEWNGVAVLWAGVRRSAAILTQALFRSMPAVPPPWIGSRNADNGLKAQPSRRPVWLSFTIGRKTDLTDSPIIPLLSGRLKTGMFIPLKAIGTISVKHRADLSGSIRYSGTVCRRINDWIWKADSFFPRRLSALFFWLTLYKIQVYKYARTKQRSEHIVLVK